LATKVRDKALLKLQAIDSEIDSLKHAVETAPEIQELKGTEDKLREAGKEDAATKEQIKDIEHVQKKLEDESARLDTKIKGEEKKLYAGTIGNPKELMALQAEISALSEEKDDVDTKFLVGEDDLKDAKDREAGMASEIDGLSRKKADLEKALKEKLRDLNERILILEQDRSEPLKALDETTLKTYGQMREKGHGVAVATVEDRVCGGCHMENSEDSGHGDSAGPVRRCEYCHRILITT
jgi:predicted  nucleic acid-binding Zn-ribbon protein